MTIKGVPVTRMDKRQLRAEIRQRICRRIEFQTHRSNNGINGLHAEVTDISVDKQYADVSVYLSQTDNLTNEFISWVEANFKPLTLSQTKTRRRYPEIRYNCNLTILGEEPRISPYR